MKILIVAAIALAGITPAAAQQTAAVAAPARLSVDSPIEALAADVGGKAVLESNFPGITAHPMYDSFKAMSLKQVQPMSQGMVTDEKIAKVADGLAAIE